MGRAAAGIQPGKEYIKVATCRKTFGKTCRCMSGRSGPCVHMLGEVLFKCYSGWLPADMVRNTYLRQMSCMASFLVGCGSKSTVHSDFLCISGLTKKFNLRELINVRLNLVLKQCVSNSIISSTKLVVIGELEMHRFETLVTKKLASA